MKSDESYIIDLCDEVLCLAAVRQYRFDFLQGDPGKRGICAKLPIDTYHEELKLAIEYRERQHSEPVPHFDKRKTLSGVSRGEQRAKYDQRRRDELPKHGIKLVELSYDDFQCDTRKRLIRDKSKDRQVIRGKLKK
ncbi:hypothetical protein HX99_02220 [Peptococcaceae bacterium SCADC1_2_3]|nr:hypothetical protein HX99_02220 [Peptococcaceae bacterium SCADC1_2_3]